MALGFELRSAPSNATEFELPADGSALIGNDITITSRYSDTLLDLARRYSVGYEEIIRANPGVDVWLPGEGTKILLPGRHILPPGPREGITVNLPENRLYYFPKTKHGETPVVITYPVSVGKLDRKTPLGQTRVISKVKHPAWHPPESIRKEYAERGDPLPRVVAPGGDNPLGDFAMRLAIGDGTFLIHGTNNPLAVGMAVTHGCVRMYPEDVAALFPIVPVGTKVSLINQPVKFAHVNGELWLEAHTALDSQGEPVQSGLDQLSQLLNRMLGGSVTAIHWDLARDILQAAVGTPTVVGLEIPPDNAPESPADESIALEFTHDAAESSVHRPTAQ